jgi:acetolactate synthase-1/2/3 large subunit
MKILLLLLNTILINSYKINSINGADYIIKKLNQYEINTVFAYPGGANLKLMDTLYKSNIKTIVNRHEQFSGFSAEGYSKSSNKIGCVITTSGPGLTNIITPLQDSYSDGIPLLAISAQVDHKKLGTSAFQECNAIALTKPCTKYNKLIKNIDELIEEFDNIVKISMTNRKGPVHLDICCNVFNEIVPSDLDIDKSSDKIIKYNKPLYKSSSFNNIYNAILKASNPVLIVGQGCCKNYENIRQFINRFNLPTTTTLHGLGIIDEDDEKALEMLGMHGSYTANNAIQQADLIIGLGYRFDDRTVGNINLYGLNAKKNYGIIHIDISHEKIDEVKRVINPTYSLLMDCNKFVNKMMEKSSNTYIKKNKGWIEYLNVLKQQYPFKVNKGMNIPYIIKKLSDKLENKKDYLICSGVGTHQMNIAQYFKWKYPNTFLTSGSQGSMGSCLGFGIGAQLANPHKTVICIDGDGSFMMSCNDLMTIVEYNLPIKIFVMDNENLGMVTNWQNDFYNGNKAFSKLKNPDFCKLANSMGIQSIKCDNEEDINDCLEQIDSNYPLLIHFKVEQQKCLPFVSPGKALDDMII